MLRQSRPFSKPKKPSASRSKHLLKKKALLNQRQKGPRCKFRIIPPDTKILFPQAIYCLYGDIPLMKIDEKLVSDFSFLNEFKFYQDIKAITKYDQKVLTMKIEDKASKDYYSWNKLVNELRFSESPQLKEWADVIQTFCQKYQRILGRQCRKKAKSDLRRSYFSQVTETTEEKKKILFQTYPCVFARFRLKNHQNQLNEMIFSEKFLKDIGYSVEGFANLVLQEGIPQLISFEDEQNDFVYKDLLEKYFTLGLQNYESPELQSLFYLKHGYVRKITYKFYCFMNYENNSFGMDLIVAILSKQDPYLDHKSSLLYEIRPSFMEAMLQKEQETQKFLSLNYNLFNSQQYSQMDKICKIKELSSFEEELFLIKKDEEI